MDNKKAFTIVELIVVVGISSIIMLVASTSTARWYLQNNTEGAKNMLISSISKAQNYAITKKKGLTWGVCMTGKTIRMFGGSCAVPTMKDDYVISDNVTVSGLSEFTFSDYRGEPNSAQSIVVAGNNETFTVVVNMAGGISVD